MKSVTIWIHAIRPRTLVASICPVLIGTSIALKEGSFNLILFAFTMLTSLGIQISTNLADDYFDFLKTRHSDERKGPSHVTQAGLVSLMAMKAAVAIACLITLLSGTVLVMEGGWPIAFLLFFSLLMALGYSGGPFPLSYLGLGDLFVFIFFGPVAVAGTYFLQTHVLVPEILLCGIGPGALATAILAACNLRDAEEDLSTKKHTLIVRFGRSWGKWEYCMLILTATLSPFLFIQDHPAAALASLIVLPAISLFRTAFKAVSSPEYIPLPRKTGQLLLLYSILFSIGWML